MTVLCHCGQPVTYGYDDNPTHTRGMCDHCDTVRCDASPGACRMTPEALAERHRIADALRDLSRLTTCHTPETRRALESIAGRVERGEL